MLHFSPKEYTELQEKIAGIDFEISQAEEKLREVEARLLDERTKMDISLSTVEDKEAIPTILAE